MINYPQFTWLGGSTPVQHKEDHEKYSSTENKDSAGTKEGPTHSPKEVLHHMFMKKCPMSAIVTAYK